jgi:hypothetical protein
MTIERLRPLFIVALVACKGRSSTTNQEPGSGSAAVATPTVVLDAAPVAPVAIDASACKPKCLYAAEHPLAEAIARHAAECKAEWYADDDCEGLLYARNCIYAAYGNVFKTAAWKDRFTNETWYKPSSKFVEKDIPAFAMANIKALKKQYEACSAPVPPVSEDDQKLAASWYERAINDEVDVEGIDVEDLRAARENLRYLHVDAKTTYEYDAAPNDGRRTIVLTGLYHAVGGGERRPDESATLTFEGDKLVDIR